ncbi:hypothetical protein [Marinobacter alexandrii]|uniref:hypothetical protein n=1 Tax=Marinobacter alexandrii TaxID=2570351 RepID=UPI00329800E4
MTYFYRYLRALIPVATFILLAGCIGSPLSSNSTAALYAWNKQDTPLTTRKGAESEENEGQYDGDYDFRNLLLKKPGLSGRENDPWLLEACDENQCFSLVLFGKDFKLNDGGTLGGYASMSALSTLMANEVRDLPKKQVRRALNDLSAQLSADSSYGYADFIRLDPRRNVDDRSKLATPGLYEDAVALKQANPDATVQDLLGSQVGSTSDLVVSEGFDFDSSWTLQVDVNLARRNTDEGYVLLCTEYDGDADGYTVDYASCPLRAQLNKGVWQGELKMTATATELLAVILHFDAPEDPEYATWNRNDDGDQFEVR